MRGSAGWRSFRYAALLGCLLIFVSACSPATPKTPTADANAVLTQAAQTVAAQLTQNPPATATPAPTNPPLPTEAPSGPTATIAAPPSAPTATTAPAASNPPASSTQDNASFVADLTIPDGTGAVPGIEFVKTWRIKNTGTTTWTVAYALVPIDGERMGSPDSIPMPHEVRPGETVDISVKLTAPAKAGSFQTFFRLRNAAGQYFRMDGTGDLWVKIAVGGSTATPDLTATVLAPSPTPTVTKTP
jgi:hypothetical protein